MELTSEIIARVLPPDLPDWVPSTPELQDVTRRLEIAGDSPQTSLAPFLWQMAVAEQLREQPSWATDSLAGLGADEPALELAVGFVPVIDIVATDEIVSQRHFNTGFFFGAVVFDAREDARSFRPSIDLSEKSEFSTPIPVVHYPAEDVLHSPPNLANATTAAWATLKNDLTSDWSALTARHAVDRYPEGFAIPFSDGGTGKLVRLCDWPVDAALVQTPTAPAKPPPRLSVESYPAVGQTVSFTDSKQSAKSGRILLTHIFPDDPDPYDGQRVYFDAVGQPGDSGALVRDQGTLRGLSIYTGTKHIRGTQVGMSQYLRQAVDLLDVDLYL